MRRSKLHTLFSCLRNGRVESYFDPYVRFVGLTDASDWVFYTCVCAPVSPPCVQPSPAYVMSAAPRLRYTVPSLTVVLKNNVDSSDTEIRGTF